MQLRLIAPIVYSELSMKYRKNPAAFLVHGKSKNPATLKWQKFM
uniref:Uncharacterized protein n=1 Tax=Rhizophora mucronata TaxID=61149 RepID=A0A2P2N5H5_RHIMU